MNRKYGLFSGKRLQLHFSSIIVLSLGLFFGGEPAQRAISQVIIGGFYYPFFKLESYVGEMRAAAAENADLRQSLVEASAALSLLQETSRENQRLRSALGFELSPGYVLLPAKVISIRGETLPVSAIINRGSEDSIMVDQTVINREGLVGRIESVTDDFAVVQLLTDPVNRVAARVADSREMGIVKFDAVEGMTLENFPIQGVVKEGDLIVSSGLGGVYAPGLTVGMVKRVERPNNEPFCVVKLVPAANFSSIEELFVLRTAEP